MNRQQFFDPSADRRPLSFWSLNDRLTEEELLAQIESMKAAGWGGFFLHARGGLLTPYMGEEWMRLCRACIDKAKEEGMYAWLYDENGWPSGTASHTVPAMDPAYRETHLFCTFDAPAHHEEDIEELYSYVATTAPHGPARGYRRLDLRGGVLKIEPNPDKNDKTPLSEGQRRVYIYVWRAPACNPRFGGVSYVDLMNPDATDAFIRSVHQPYKELAGEEFGKTVPGIFTDDITIKWDLYGCKTDALPWTGRLAELFRARFGYDIRDRLSDLFFDTEGATATRADYFALINELFAENFVGRMAAFCEKNRLMQTGHLMGNEGIYSDVLYQFYLMQAPATDHLGAELKGFARHRRAASVAAQFDKPEVLCELYGGVGHELSFPSQRRISDFLAIAGVTLLVPHISQYSMRNFRKRDHPPAFSYQIPYFEGMKPLGDYQGRLSLFAKTGKPDAKVLLLYPIEGNYISSAQKGANDEADKIRAYADRVEQLLLEAHVEYSWGSETLLARHGKATAEGLTLGSMTYPTVIVPYTSTLRRSTVALLKEYIDLGGQVIAVGRIPPLCDGKRDGTCADALKGAQIIPCERLYDRLLPMGLPLRDAEGNCPRRVMTSVRKEGDQYYCLLLNLDTDRGVYLSLDLPQGASARIYDLTSGQVSPALCRDTEQGRALSLFLTPGASAMVGWGGEDICGEPARPLPPPVLYSARKSLPDDWSLTLHAPNALALDTFSVIAGGVTKEPADFTRIVERADYALEAVFSVSDWDGVGGRLAVEDKDAWEVTLNGLPLAPADGWYIDRCMGLFSLEGAVKEGENRLRLTLKQGYRLGPETVFVLGNFGVYGDGTVYGIRGHLPTRVRTNLTEEGLAFYSGCATLTQTLSVTPKQGARYLLRIRRTDTCHLTARLNGQLCPDTLATPYVADVTHLLKEGDNTLSVTLWSSLRNSYGPLHFDHKGGGKFVTPGLYGNPNNFTDCYNLEPFGIEGAELVEIL